MNKRLIQLSLIILVLVSATGYSYQPVITIGATGYAGVGSSDPSAPNLSVGPEVNLDFRAIAGSWGYVAAWYTGHLWFDSATTPVYAHDTGGLLGVQLGEVATEVRAALAYSSTIGDGSTFATPEWRVSADIPTGVARLELALGGFYHVEPETDELEVTHDLEFAVAYDRSLELTVTGGVAPFASVFPDQDRVDIGGQAYLATEGLLGFFTWWDASLAGGIVESDEDSNDRVFATLAGSIETSTVRSLTSSAALRLKLSSYPALDTTALRIEPTAGIDWNPFGGIYLQAELSGVYGISRDATMDGWNVGGSLGLHYRF